MFDNRMVLTRDTLYQQLWSEPILHLVARLGLSDRGLAKLCARHDIPVPSRGWWAKKQHSRYDRARFTAGNSLVFTHGGRVFSSR